MNEKEMDRLEIGEKIYKEFKNSGYQFEELTEEEIDKLCEESLNNFLKKDNNS